VYIYIIRHGETVWNTEGKLQGSNDLELNENGILLAELTGREMKGIHFDEAFTSPLLRAKRTASIVLKESDNTDTPLHVDKRLIEVNMGEWEGVKFRFTENTLDKEIGRYVFGNPSMNFQFPGGELIQHVADRTQNFLKELAARNDDKTYLVSMHGFALRAMLNFLYEDKDNFWQGHVPYNCAVNIIEAKDGEIKLIEADKVYYDKDKIKDYYSKI